MTPGAAEDVGAGVEELGTAEAEDDAGVEAEDGIVVATVVDGVVDADADVGGAVCVDADAGVPDADVDDAAVVDGKTAGLPTSTH